MKYSTIALALLIALTTANPFKHSVHLHHHALKRDIVFVTETKYVMETQIAYQTAWVYPDGSPVSSTASAQPSVAATHAPVSAAHSAAPSVNHIPPPQQTHYGAPAPSSAHSYEAPAAPHVASSAPAIHTAPAAPPAPHVAPPPAAPAPAAPVTHAAPPPAAPTPAAPAPATGMFNGQMTYYDVGLGSCGLTSVPSDYIVAIPVSQMNNPANPNANLLCGKSVTIHYGGKTATAKIVDTCMGCKSGDLDMSTSLFSYFAPMSEGRVSGMSWSIDG